MNFLMFSGVDVAVTLGNTKEFYGLKGQSVVMKCVLNSGSFDTQFQRRWLADGVTLISNGILSSAGNGYSETLDEADKFGLKTPILDNSFNGTTYKCIYDFLQASLFMKIAGKCKIISSK